MRILPCFVLAVNRLHLEAKREYPECIQILSCVLNLIFDVLLLNI